MERIWKRSNTFSTSDKDVLYCESNITLNEIFTKGQKHLKKQSLSMLWLSYNETLLFLTEETTFDDFRDEFYRQRDMNLIENQ